MMTLKKGDTVLVLSGRERGKKGVIERTYPSLSRVVVTGVNIRKRHMKPSKTQPKGGILEFPAALNRSSVMLVCPHCSKPTRIKHQVDGDSKVRICAHCSSSLETK